MEKNSYPEGWRVVQLGEVARYINGRAFKPGEWEKAGLPIIRIQNLNKETASYNYSTKRFEEKYKVKNGDLLFAWSASLGAYIWTGGEAWLNQHIFRVEPIDNCDKRYLFYGLERTVAELYSKAHGSGMVHVTKGKFQATEIPLPPLSEQQRIVAKIEELFSELDAGKQELEKVAQQLRVYRQAVLKWAFEGKLTNDEVVDGELPEGWEWVKLEEVANSFGGYAFKSGDFKDSGKYQVVRMGNVRPGQIRFNESPVFLDEVEEKVLQKTLLAQDDIIITLTGTRKKRDYGFTAIINHEKLLLNQRIAAVRFNETYLPKFFLYFSWTDKFKDQFFENETGNVGQGNVGMKAITQTLIPFLPLEEQHRIVQEIEARLSVCDKIEETIAGSLLQAEALRQSILKRAFEGKL